MCSWVWVPALIFSYMDTHSQDFETEGEKRAVSLDIIHLAALVEIAIFLKSAWISAKWS